MIIFVALIITFSLISMTRIKIVTLFLSIIFSSAITTVSAVENDSIAVNDSISIVDIINNDSLSTIQIIQSNELNKRIMDNDDEIIIEEKKDNQKSSDKATPKRVTAGKQVSYRILAFNKANQRDQAMTLARQINSRFPQYGAKVSSNLPYWQVWVGLFFNEKDAQRARNEIKSAFPQSSPSVRKANVVVKR